MPDIADFPNSSTHLQLPYIQPNQAQKHVTHNEGMLRLDAIVQLSVVSADIAAPPSTPAEGARHIVPAGASGVWSGQDAMLAVFQGGGWTYLNPKSGWTAWVVDQGKHVVFDGAVWRAVQEANDHQNLQRVGIRTSADDTNRLAVASDATLLTHEGGGHQVKVNKAATGDTASLLFQTDWQARAEMGTAGSDDFEIKVSADGATFNTALRADAATGRVEFPAGVDGIAPSAFGTGPLLTVDYVTSRGLDLVTNGTGILGNGYNFPSAFMHDPLTTPNLPASFSYAGYYSSEVATSEYLAVDPNQVWRLGCYLMQEKLSGDWSAYGSRERHTQYMGLLCYDLDRQPINAFHHMRYRKNGIDSLTTLAAPLAPGDTILRLVDSSGWNSSAAPFYQRGLIILGYRNDAGGLYTHYSRHIQFDMFGAGAIDGAAHTVTLSSPFPASMGNPDDPDGIWPAGTRIANSDSGGNFKYVCLHGTRMPKAGQWYRATGYIGGIDLSGSNAEFNFPPGTAYVRPFWIPNHSNRPGGSGGSPDTGADHRVWFAGTSVTPEPLARLSAVATGSASGSMAIKVPMADFATGAISLQPPVRSLVEL
ncbi:Protein of unknown function [Roseovarius nanhaiticus]|uniref:DUF2793 domain-containing protein n=1 Tax=Roseovarius nanhaiticus TaxID=573024 RepID=A0A1N7EPG2_9RHOB|nr:DUF2793 domain-containing protein [Roseovarius nanhaiticus]SEK70264.1 Protein of unknown function [Roseovarius nanhaiticus]SIR89825.1 Protein of unknown function [Roseovarius nanhaiticus]